MGYAELKIFDDKWSRPANKTELKNDAPGLSLKIDGRILIYHYFLNIFIFLVKQHETFEAGQIHRAEVVILRQDSSTDSEKGGVKNSPLQTKKVDEKSKDTQNEFLSVKMENLKQRRLLEAKDKEIDQLMKQLKEGEPKRKTTPPKNNYHFGERTTLGISKERPTYHYGEKSPNLSQNKKPTNQQSTVFGSKVSTATSNPSSKIYSTNYQPVQQTQEVTKPSDTFIKSVPIKVTRSESPETEAPRVHHIPIKFINVEEEKPQPKNQVTEAIVTIRKSPRSQSQSSSSSDEEKLNYHPYANFQSFENQNSPSSTLFASKNPTKAEFPRYFKKTSEQKKVDERPKSMFYESDLQPLTKSLTASDLAEKETWSNRGYTPVVPQPGTSKSLWNVSNSEKSNSLGQTQKMFSMSKPTDLDSIQVLQSSESHNPTFGKTGVLRPMIAGKTGFTPQIEITPANEPLYQNLGPGFPVLASQGPKSNQNSGSSSSEEEDSSANPTPVKKSTLASKFFKLGSNKNKVKGKKEDLTLESSSEGEPEEEEKSMKSENPKKKKGLGSIFKSNKSKNDPKLQASSYKSFDDDSDKASGSDEKHLKKEKREIEEHYENLRGNAAESPNLKTQEESDESSSSEEDVNETQVEENTKPKKPFGGFFKTSKLKNIGKRQQSPPRAIESDSSEKSDSESPLPPPPVVESSKEYENLPSKKTLHNESKPHTKGFFKSIPKGKPAPDSSSEEDDDDEVFTEENIQPKKQSKPIINTSKFKSKGQKSPSISQDSDSGEKTDTGSEKQVQGSMEHYSEKDKSQVLTSKDKQKLTPNEKSPPSADISIESEVSEQDDDAEHHSNSSSEAEYYDKMDNFKESPKPTKKKGFSGLFSSSRGSGKTPRRQQPTQREEEADYQSDNEGHSEPQRSFNSRQRRNSQGFGSLFGSKRKAKKFQQHQREQAREDQRRGSTVSRTNASARGSEEEDLTDHERGTPISGRRRDTSFSSFFGSARGNPSKTKSMGNLVVEPAEPRRGKGQRTGLQAATSTGSLSRAKRDTSFGSFLGTPGSRKKQMQRSATQPVLNRSSSGSDLENGRSASEESLRQVQKQRSERPKSTSALQDDDGSEVEDFRKSLSRKSGQRSSGRPMNNKRNNKNRNSGLFYFLRSLQKKPKNETKFSLDDEESGSDSHMSAVQPPSGIQN